MPPNDLPVVLLPSAAAERIHDWQAAWGWVDLFRDRTERLCVVRGVGRTDAVRTAVPSEWQKVHYLRSADSVPWSGVWYRVDPIVHDMHRYVLTRGTVLNPEDLKSAVINGWRVPPAEHSMLVLTWSPVEDGPPTWTAWWVSRDMAIPALLEVVTDTSPLTFLGDAWPVEELGKATVLLVGVGSIGSVAAEVLASYAVGRLVLIDPDRLFQRNLVRHRLGPHHLGRYKVNAMADVLRDRYPEVVVEPYDLDVIRDTDSVRPLIGESDVVVGSPDGVSPRRVVNHLARRAGIPTVLACVLEDGAYGEIIRVRPGAGCLLCYRERLTAEGAFDPEPALDAGYGQGTTHLPMTAVTGDLATVGTLAAKAAVATLLEQRGHFEQRLPGDVAIVGLRPVPARPDPFDIERAGEIRWKAIGPSRPGCPTCAAP